jgi:hypothetical protein
MMEDSHGWDRLESVVGALGDGHGGSILAYGLGLKRRKWIEQGLCEAGLWRGLNGAETWGLGWAHGSCPWLGRLGKGTAVLNSGGEDGEM